MNAAESLPRRLQGWLEELYRLPPLAPVDAFLVEGRAVNGPTETLLVRETGNDLELGLYLDPRILERFATRGGLDNFPRQSLEDFWTLLEGVSHFVCLGWHAERNREISALDLEIQAEIDKYVSAREFCRQSGLGDIGEQLHETLFSEWKLGEDMDADLAERYRRASEIAARYCRYLQSRHDDSLGLRAELRDFFRLSPQRRRERIHELARD